MSFLKKKTAHYIVAGYAESHTFAFYYEKRTDLRYRITLLCDDSQSDYVEGECALAAFGIACNSASGM